MKPNFYNYAQGNNKRIFGKGVTVSNDACHTNHNNNDLIIGPSGAGKTTGYVIPNLALATGSYVVADTKCSLAKLLSPMFRKLGYTIHIVNFVDLTRSEGYNPLDYIETTNEYGHVKYSVQQVIKLVGSIYKPMDKRDQYWDDTAKKTLTSVIGYVLETCEPEERNLISVCRIAQIVNTPAGDKLFATLKDRDPESYAVRKYSEVKSIALSEKTWACIQSFLLQSLFLFDTEEAHNVFSHSDFSLKEIGSKPTVVFLNVSDNDRSYDQLVNTFYTQTLQQLIELADSHQDKRLEIPVRIILDDFATNAYIQDFDKIISIIRSREIYVSVILQGLTQLEAMYGSAKANTIISNCEHMLYLGGQDPTTATYISQRVNKPLNRVYALPGNKAYLFERGSEPRLIDKLSTKEALDMIKRSKSMLLSHRVSYELESDEYIEETLTKSDTDFSTDGIVRKINDLLGKAEVHETLPSWADLLPFDDDDDIPF